jgi:branched-chain amino acid transport system substrate-binding protein
MKGIFFFCIVIGSSFIPGCGLFAPEKKPVKIAAIINMSGPAAHMTAVRYGIDLAVEEINGSGGINGHPVEIIYRDNRSSPREAAKQFAAVEKEHRPLLYISTSSSCSTALAEHAEKNRVVVVGLMTSSDEFPGLSRWVVRYYFTSKNEAKAAMKIIRRLHIKKLGFLYQDDEFGRSVYRAFIKQEEAKKYTIYPEPFKSKSPSLTENIKKLLNTDAIYLVCFAKRYKTAVPEMRSLKYKGQIITHSGASIHFIRKLPEAEKVYVAAPFIYNPNYFFAAEYNKSLEKKFNKRTSHYNGIGYDIIILIKNLMTGREMTRINVRKRLSSGFIHPGIFGDVKTEKGSNDIGLPLFPAQIKGGTLHYLN